MLPESGRVDCEKVAEAPNGSSRVCREARFPSSHTCGFESRQEHEIEAVINTQKEEKGIE